MAQLKKRKTPSRKGLSLDYSEVENLVRQLKALDGNVKQATETALIKSRQYINKNLHKEMKKHKRTGKTEESIEETSNPTWIGSSAEIDVGFRISNGGLASAFLLYGTPRMDKDQKLYNALYGKRTADAVAKIQKEVFDMAIEKVGG